MSKKHKETVQKQFTKTVAEFSIFAVRDTAEVLAEHAAFAKAQPNDLVLDVACGSGTLVLALAPTVRLARGVDLTRAMLRQARQFQLEKQITNACFDRADAELLPYPGGAFDLVTCRYTFHHLQKPVLVLKEMLRVAKPEGRLLLVDSLAPESDAKFQLHNQIERWRDPSHTESLRLTTFLALFDELGLEVLRQAVRRRVRSFNAWMHRAGLSPAAKRYQETRRLMEKSIPGDAAGFAAKVEGDDISIVHNEASFLLKRQGAEVKP